MVQALGGCHPPPVQERELLGALITRGLVREADLLRAQQAFPGVSSVEALVRARLVTPVALAALGAVDLEQVQELQRIAQQQAVLAHAGADIEHRLRLQPLDKTDDGADLAALAEGHGSSRPPPRGAGLR